MRKYYSIAILLLVVGTLITPGFASFTMPRLVYRMGQLNEAKEMARDKDIPITFIYTDESTNCGLCTAASLDVVEELKDCTVIIYVNSEHDQDWDQTPNVVRRAINSPKAGKFIPIAVIVDPDIKKVYYIVPYVRDVDERKDNLRKVRSTIHN